REGPPRGPRVVASLRPGAMSPARRDARAGHPRRQPSRHAPRWAAPVRRIPSWIVPQDTELLEIEHELAQRETNHVGIGARDTEDQEGPHPLDRVRARLVATLTCRYVSGELLLRSRPHPDPRLDTAGALLPNFSLFD